MPLPTAEDIVSRYPLLFTPREGGARKNPSFHFEHGPGWFNIIDALCATLYAHYDSARARYEHLRSREGLPTKYAATPVTAVTVEKARLDMHRAGLELPRVLQVKEKFGDLRFYVDHGDNQIFALIEMAAYLSAATCEKCGAPGTRRDGGWIKTLCDEHHAKKS